MSNFFISTAQHRVWGSALWVFFGYAGGQGLRLIGNLILTRLLFPEAFGVMALLTIFLQGLDAFSDVGIGPSIIQNKRGRELPFLNTAWTIQIIRGFILWSVGSLLAWPLSRFYNQPEILYLLPFVCFNTIIAGFNSTGQFTMNRELRVARLTVLEIASQGIGIAVMIFLAWKYRNIWSLVIGGIITHFVKALGSHLFLENEPHRLCMNREMRTEMMKFGRWIFLSTTFAFIAAQGDRLILGKLLTMAELGVYSIAFFLSQALVQAMQAISGKVLLPLYAHLKEESPEAMQKKIFHVRTRLMAICFLPICILISAGNFIVDILYDDRYATAGWMLQILSIGTLAAVLNATISPILMAVGNSFRFMLMLVAKVSFLILAMTTGGWFFGITGLVWGIALSGFLFYPVLGLGVRRYGIWTPVTDLLYFASTLSTSGALWLGLQNLLNK